MENDLVSTMAHTERTSLGLRDALFDEIDALRNGNSNPQRASALARLAGQIVNTVRVEIAHQHFVQSASSAGGKIANPANLRLGRDSETVERKK